ncbi:MAG: hypothetical protein QF464_20710, partial [Myxococcota bacterium]|nr:hypothetical protein [Myxococcota bacterium]
MASFAGPDGPVKIAGFGPGIAAPTMGWASAEPQLVTHLNALRAAGMLSTTGASLAPPAAAFLAELSSLAPTQAKHAGQLLRRAGWSEPELQMLRLGHAESAEPAGGPSSRVAVVEALTALDAMAP